MRTTLLLLTLIWPLIGVGQTWETVNCNEIFLSGWCAQFATVATIDPINQPHLFHVNTADSTNAWQYGASAKPFLGTTDSVVGWVTDLSQPYTMGLKSELVVTVPRNEEWPGLPSWILFEHKFEMGSANDGGYVQFSCDSLIWTTISSSYVNWSYLPEELILVNYAESTIHDTIEAFTNSSEDWMSTGIDLAWVIPVFQGEQNRDNVGCSYENMDTVFFKFVFESDSIDDQMGGWMIRNFTIGNHDTWGSVGETGYLPLSIYPNPTTTTTTVRIQLPDNTPNATDVRIYDLMGRMVHQQSYNPVVDVSALPSGNYILQVNGTTQSFRGVLTKQ